MSALTCARPLAGQTLAGFALLFAIVLSGCDKGRLDESQIIARVNADEISVHQLRFAMQRAPRPAATKTEQDALVEKMIDRQIAVQQSQAQGLDRRPDVMMRLEEARRDILAAAYADEVSGKVEKPGEDAGARYFAEHPGMFANRKIYRLREISVPEGEPAMAEAQARIERRERLVDLGAWLRQQPGRFSDQLALRPAEQLPIEVVDRLSKLKPGETIAFRLPRALVIYEVQSAEAAPLTWQAAAPIIKEHLARTQGATALSEELKRLRAAAQVSRKSSAG